MNTLKTSFLSLTSLVALVSCSSTVYDRIQENQTTFNSLPEAEKTYVAKGQISQGMSSNGVRIAWGEPDTVASGKINGKDSERWLYNNGGGSGWSFGVGGGLGHGHHNTGYGLGSGVSFPISHIPDNYSYVLFMDGKVNSWEGQGKN